MQITELHVVGFKAGDIHIDNVGDVEIFVGENGAGKSLVLNALRMLATGRAPEPLSQKPDGVLALMRGEKASITATVRLDRERIGRVGRTWTVTRKKVKGEEKLAVVCEADASVFGGARNAQDSDLLLRTYLGGWEPAWAPGEFLSLSVKERQKRLLSMAGAAGDPAKVSMGLPSWATEDLRVPGLNLNAVEWVEGALRKAKERLSAVTKEATTAAGNLKVVREQVEQLPAANAADDARLDAVRAAVAARATRGVRQSEIAMLEGEVRRLTNDIANLEAQQGRHLRDRLERVSQSITADEAARQNLGIEGEPPQPTTEQIGAAVRTTVEAAAQLKVAEQAHAAAKGSLKALRMLTSQTDALGLCQACRTSLRLTVERAEDEVRGRDFEAKAAEDNLSTVRSAEGLLHRQAQWHVLSARVAAYADEQQDLLDQLADKPDWNAATAEQRGAKVLLERAERFERERARYVAQLAEAQERVRVATEAYAALPAAPDTIDADLEELEAAARRKAQAESVRSELARAEARVAELADEVTEARATVADLEGRRVRILRDVVADIEARMSEATGDEIIVRLVDERGNPDCTILRNGVGLDTLSDGEQITSLAGLLVALVPAARRDAYKPLMIDRLESVSAGRRRGFLDWLTAVQGQGLVDQVWVTGCPDGTGWASEDVRLTLMSRSGSNITLKEV